MQHPRQHRIKGKQQLDVAYSHRVLHQNNQNHKMVRLAITLLALCAVASARMAYQLPIGVEDFLSARSFTESFSCEGLPYGYYADTDNNCELFHICLPVTDFEGALIETAHFTMACGNATVFDQQNLACTTASEAVPCEEAQSFYETSNAEFGIIPLPKEKK